MTDKVLRVYADGVFDGFHIGHSNMLKQCREAFPDQKIWLIAGVCDQKDVEEHKGNLLSIQAPPSVQKRKDYRWSRRTSMLMKCSPTPLGS
jgi:cytidyltransferase-like protein